MKILLVTVDSKYIHSNLAVRYLRSFLLNDGIDIEIKEFTINQQQDYVLSEILAAEPELICFSCYIWNIEYIKEVAYILKEANPDIKILCGGPEVSFETKKFMDEEIYVDYVVAGEGELSFREFLKSIQLSNPNFFEINGLCFRDGDKIIINSPREPVENLDTINYPYNEGEDFADKIVYYESSRGCPFRCSFCMSSIDKKIRYFSLERVKRDLKRLLSSKARQIKFVDRTFNADYKRAIEIMEFIVDNNPEYITVHFEITADIINDEFLEFLKKMPVNMFQFEIGVQTLNEATLFEINRGMNIERLFRVIRGIGENKNIHMHLDLIAGLPFEGYESFKESFNGIHKLRAEKIQLGFLKVLKGTKIFHGKEIHEIKYRKTAPYEVISTKYIGMKHILKLKRIEELVDKYYNEKYFEKALDLVIQKHYKDSPFEFYEEFSSFWQKGGLYRVSHGRKKLYEIFYSFLKCGGILTKELEDSLRYDYVFNNRNEELPEFLNKEMEEGLKQVKRKLSNSESFKNKYFNEYKKEDRIANSFRIVEINSKVVLFKYLDKNNIFKRCETFEINPEDYEYEQQTRIF